MRSLLSIFFGLVLASPLLAFPTQEQAIARATAYMATYPGSHLASILPTGSMFPTLDWDCIVVIVPVPYEQVKAKDIALILRLNDETKVLEQVLHRVRYVYSSGLLMQGDNALNPDPGVVTKDYYRGVVGFVAYFKVDAPKPLPAVPQKLRNPFPGQPHRSTEFTLLKEPPAQLAAMKK